MAFGKNAIGLMLAVSGWLPAAQFTVRHEHVRKYCEGVLTIDENGVQFAGAKDHRWSWAYQEIQELKLSRERVAILSYQNTPHYLGGDGEYKLDGTSPADELYKFLSGRMD